MLGDSLELAQPADIDESARLCQPESHHRNETVAARQNLGTAALSQRRERVPQGGRPGVFETGRDHDAPPFAFCIAAQTRAGVSGLSIWRTPRGSSALHTALTSAAAGGNVSGSPMPLTASGLTRAGGT